MSERRFQYDRPDDALDALIGRLAPVSVESLLCESAVGRVLAEPIRTDRESPPCDVSAMDGYAVRLSDVCAGGALRVAGEIPIGTQAPTLPQGHALRIVTGAAVPPEADVVIQREHVIEHADRVEFPPGFAPPAAGTAIRRRGENLGAGQCVLQPGAAIEAPTVAALASFGVTRVSVYRRLRVAIIITGDELLSIDSTPLPWQIRDSNGPTLAALLAGVAWVEVASRERVADRAADQQTALERALADCDAVILTGGVSMGDYDFVPGVVRAVGAEVVFHRIPIRPGQPMLAAVTRRNQTILALPGNPISSAVTTRRFGLRALRRLAGCAETRERPALARPTNDDGKTIDLWWYRLARRVGDGTVELTSTRGSGDVVSLARSDGFLEVPPHAASAGPWPYYPWSGLR